MGLGYIVSMVAGVAFLASPVLAGDRQLGAPVLQVAAKTKVSVPKQVGGGKGHKGVVEPGVSYATAKVKCGDTTYEISSGASGGACAKSSDGRTFCNDKNGNYATASCGGGCGETDGKGSCKVVAN